MVTQRFSRFRQISQFVGLIFASLFIVSCATVNLANMGEEGYSLEADEERMQNRVNELIEMVDATDSLYEDAALDQYFTDLANSMIPDKAKSTGVEISIKVVKDPVFNAFSFNTGRIYLHTGMIAIAENEAQIAQLIGHEVAHVLNRHAIKQFRSTKNKTAFISTLSGFGLYGLFGQLAAVSSIFGYSQHHEYEADEVGFQMFVDAGYDIYESPKLFEHIDEFLDAEEIKEPFFFSTHPKIKKRIKKYESLIKDMKVSEGYQGKLLAKEYRARVKPIVELNIELNLKKGYFKTAQKSIEKFIKEYPDDELGYFLEGELYRQRQDKEKKEKFREKNEDYKLAVKAYSKAIAINDNNADAHKGLGLVLLKDGNKSRAREVFQEFLAISDNVNDSAYIANIVKQIETDK